MVYLLYIHFVQNYNKNKGYVTLKIKEPISIGDKVSIKNENGSYTISELMVKNNNIKETKINQTVTIGRIKGSINLGDKIYKISSKSLANIAKESYKNEKRKQFLWHEYKNKLHICALLSFL